MTDATHSWGYCRHILVPREGCSTLPEWLYHRPLLLLLLSRHGNSLLPWAMVPESTARAHASRGRGGDSRGGREAGGLGVHVSLCVLRGKIWTGLFQMFRVSLCHDILLISDRLRAIRGETVPMLGRGLAGTLSRGTRDDQHRIQGQSD